MFITHLKMQSLPKELQFGVISADWYGLKFASTCRAFADYVRENAETLRTKYSREEKIDLRNDMYLRTSVLPNDKYSGYTYLHYLNGELRGTYLYENNKLVKYQLCFMYRWNYTHQNGNTKYVYYTNTDRPDFSDIEEYEANPTKLDEYGDPNAMWTAGCANRLVANYLYNTGSVAIEIEWGTLKVNVRATVKYYGWIKNNRARVYPYEERANLWIDEISSEKTIRLPNWSVLCEIADEYFHTFVRDESLNLTCPVDEENINFNIIHAPPDIALPPGFKRL